MISIIKANGTLEITSESDLEEYALSKWFEDYRCERVLLCIRTTHPINPELDTTLIVKNNETK